MADNDIYVIRKARPLECDICPHEDGDCEDIECPKEEGKTRAEYEDMIAESIYNQISKEEFKHCTFGIPDFATKNLKIKAKNYAKAVVVRLFGEGE